MAPSLSFDRFLFRKENRLFLGGTIAFIVLSWVIFKICYPQMAIFADSISYIAAAAKHQVATMRPAGYSIFLFFFRVLVTSDLALTTLQFLLLEASLVWLYFTIDYFLPWGKRARWVAWILFFCNPLFYYVANFVSSDALFSFLSICWLTQLLWILRRPHWKMILVHAFTLLLAFTFRYNALYYPLLTITVLFLAPTRIWWKAMGTVLSLGLIGFFIWGTTEQNYEVTGIRQFSAFSGWQEVNNALYLYPHVRVDTAEVPPSCKRLDSLVRVHFDKVPGAREVNPVSQGAYYLSDASSPLFYYLFTYGTEPRSSYLGFASVSVAYRDYGRFLMRKYPVPYVRYYLVPNVVNYFCPAREKLSEYNNGFVTFPKSMANWFGISSPVVHTLVPYDLEGHIMWIFPYLFSLLNIAFLLTLGLFLYKKRYRHLARPDNHWILIIAAYILINAAFSIIASPSVLRYQVCPMVFLGVFVLWMIDKARVFSRLIPPGR